MLCIKKGELLFGLFSFRMEKSVLYHFSLLPHAQAMKNYYNHKIFSQVPVIKLNLY